MADSTSTDLVVLDLDKVEEVLLGQAQDVGFLASQVDDPTEVQRQIVARILAAESADDVLSSQSTTAATDLVGVPLQVANVRWMQSRVKDAAIPVFALIDAVRGDDGSKVLVTCGAIQVMAQLVKLQKLGAFPIDLKIVQKDTPTAAGYYPLWLEALAPTPASA